MHIQWQGIMAMATLVWLYLKRIWDKVSKIAIPLIKEAEQLALDGKIDKTDRKKLVMSAIQLLEDQGKIKLGPIEKIIVSVVVDKIAAKLPDFTVNKEALTILNEAKGATQ